ncbi:TetR/AcrR family transcriptional regulator [Salimicrobium sp. PL1-032A]|uniref:TetR/AcrR family transcriptional regulator n=1 Tax=Salimicrobium sp. PL1-032A TaxID=3095364 RepID=UPI0032609C20
MNKTEQRIIDVAIDVLAKDERASMEMIAEQAGVSRMTIHRYFKNRELLFTSIHEELIGQTLAIFREATGKYDSPRDQIEAIIRKGAGQRGFHLLFREHAHHEDHDPRTCKFSEVNRELMTLIGKLREAGDIDASVPDAWVFHTYDSVLLTAWETMHNGTVAPKDIPALTWRTFARGVLT